MFTREDLNAVHKTHAPILNPLHHHALALSSHIKVFEEIHLMDELLWCRTSTQCSLVTQAFCWKLSEKTRSLTQCVGIKSRGTYHKVLCRETTALSPALGSPPTLSYTTSFSVRIRTRVLIKWGGAGVPVSLQPVISMRDSHGECSPRKIMSLTREDLESPSPPLGG